MRIHSPIIHPSAGDVPRQPQDKTQASYYGGRTADDGELDLSATASVCHNLVRAVTQPFPGAFTFNLRNYNPKKGCTDLTHQN